MKNSIAIVGMACCYPDARSPVQLWENALAQRRAFRRLPQERLNTDDYFSSDPTAPDRTYSVEAAVIEGYEFDRVRFRVAGNTYRATDLAHWLALDIASQALLDAGFPEGKGLPREQTGVLLGNTLTGEFSRANLMRLRWPYVRRVLAAALRAADWSSDQRHDFLKDLEVQYKTPFPEVGEETLAGGLSNTIAGRICNHFDLKGGGYTVDGACASSLLAVSNACTALVAEDLDVALAGGVDLSLDPFELVGFAKAGALAKNEMRVYDARSEGFWPGEGCGFVVLMRHGDALAQQRRIYAVIRGWGVSSDGSGGITRPEAAGQMLALRRAYRRAGFGVDTVAYFEGHGTGTAVGDATELSVLSRARREAKPAVSAAAIGSVKANIGHTKAAAGVAGLLKAVMALHTQIIPPTTGCQVPHAEFARENPALRVLNKGTIWPANQPLRASVSAMGFGGINTHVVLEGFSRAAARRNELSARERELIASPQDAELFLLSAADANQLQQQVDHLLSFSAELSRAELTDLAAQLAGGLEKTTVRGALIAATPLQLTQRLETLKAWLAAGVAERIDLQNEIYLGAKNAEPRIGFLFPGQGSPACLDGGAWRRRFAGVRSLYERATFPHDGDGVDTAVAQPAIVTASLAALRILGALGVRARVAVGHSLGELVALHWAGALDDTTLLEIAAVRGRAMAELGSPTGLMVSIDADQETVAALLEHTAAVIAGLNSPKQTVISGESKAVEIVIERAAAKGLNTFKLPVSHAFHSPLLAAAAQPLAAHLRQEKFVPLRRTVISTVTGAPLGPETDLNQLLIRQVTAPVQFVKAVTQAAQDVDLLIEVGSGKVLSGLTGKFCAIPTVALDACGASLAGLLNAVGVAFALGAELNLKVIFAGRSTRPFDLNWAPRFFANPCELTPAPKPSTTPNEKVSNQDREPIKTSALDLIRALVAERAELPPETVKAEDRMLSDLHLNSLTVGQLVSEASRSLNVPAPVAPTDYADARVIDIAEALESLQQTGNGRGVQHERLPAGVDTWIRPFTVELIEKPLIQRHTPADGDWQVVSSDGHPLAPALQRAFERLDRGCGLVVCLPPNPDEGHLKLLLKSVQTVLSRQSEARFVLVQQGGGAASLVRTLHLEAPQITVCVVDVPFDHPQAGDWVVAEALAAQGYVEAHYDRNGQRRVPTIRLLPESESVEKIPLDANDVLLVSGGGKGISAECALSLAQETGVRLALLGRSHPDEDEELDANLKRLSAVDIDFRYVPADVTDKQAVRAAIQTIEADLGPVTAFLHGAGTNVPQLLQTLDEAALLRTLAPKLDGARNILAAVDPKRLKLFIAFGSIIARTGLPGEADYGLANEWLTRLTESFQAKYPSCRCLSIEWSIWSGVGMGERLGRVDALTQQGITPITPEEGINVLLQLLRRPSSPVAVVVSGRCGDFPTLRMEAQELPFLRFLENPVAHYPGVELVTEVELSTRTDPYLEDHVFQGQRLLPAVMGLEAMAQAAMGLMEASTPPRFEDVQFLRPVVVPDGDSLTIRIAALVRSASRIDVVLRSEETAYQVDHFRATCRFGAEENGEMKNPDWHLTGFPPLMLDPERELYGGLLFQRGRFQRLRGYRHLLATECVAEIAAGEAVNWFSRYLPQTLVLGDPGARDAVLHAIQACVPHATLLPIGVERLLEHAVQTVGPWIAHAKERVREGDLFIYDVTVTTTGGQLLQRWEGLHLKLVGEQTAAQQWAAPLLGPYLQRRMGEFAPNADIAVVVERTPGLERRAGSDQAIQRAVGQAVSVLRRPDGKPQIENSDSAVSTTHADGLTMAVVGSAPLSCDIEYVIVRPESEWQDLLGTERHALANVIARELEEGRSAVSTRVWTAIECLKKAGMRSAAPLILHDATPDGWLLLKSGSLMIATYKASVTDDEAPLVLALLVKG